MKKLFAFLLIAAAIYNQARQDIARETNQAPTNQAEKIDPDERPDPYAIECWRLADQRWPGK